MKKKTAVLKRAMTERSVKDGKTKSGMARQNPDDSSQLVKTAARAHTIRGKNLSLEASGKRSLRRLTQWEPL